MNRTAALLCCATGLLYQPSIAADVSKPLLDAIKKVSPTGDILQANEIDVKGCAPVPKSPALVRADLNGDGLEDVAVLLKTFVSNEITIWQGQKLRRANFLFVIFLNDGKGDIWRDRWTSSRVIFRSVRPSISERRGNSAPWGRRKT